MHSIFMVIVNNGDGSSGIEWHSTMDDEKMCALEEQDPEMYSSGDGIQVHEFKFDTSEAMLNFIRLNIHFGFYEEQNEDE